MHVLILSAGYPTTYDEKKSIFHQAQAEALARAGCQVGVIAVVPISVKEVLRKKRLQLGWYRRQVNQVSSAVYQYLSIPKMRRQWLDRPLSRGKKEFIQYVKTQGLPDVVHLHSFQAGLLALWIKEEYGVKVVVTEHSSRFYADAWSPLMLKIAVYIFQKCDYRIAVSPLFAKRLEEISQVSFEYIPNCVDTDFFNPAVTHPIPKDVFTFICVGSFTRNKNQGHIAKAFLSHFTAEERVQVVFIGQGEQWGAVKNQFEAAGRSHQVVFVKAAFREELRDWLGKAQVLLSASKIETFGITLIEAMSMGLPVLATRSGGPQAIVVNETLGYLVEPNEFGQRMKEIKADYPTFRGAEIRAHVEQEYSFEAVAKRLLAVYQKL